ncbi:MAG: hypothetical protein Q8878_03960 [Bacillota bacterium]|nr:hypothetical protein [Bacillota bacterium]
MRHFLIASHGPLSQAILDSASLVSGRKGEFVSIGVEMNDSRETVRGRVNKALSGWPPEDEILALTDIIGGNVTNILTDYIKSRNLNIITGVNLGMVLEALFSDRDIPMEELVESIVSMGRAGIKHINSLLIENNEEDAV